MSNFLSKYWEPTMKLSGPVFCMQYLYASSSFAPALEMLSLNLILIPTITSLFSSMHFTQSSSCTWLRESSSPPLAETQC